MGKELLNTFNKELLLKDLCARLVYGVKVQTTYISPKTKEKKDVGIDILSTVEISMLIDDYYELKPYLFPLSSMTDELWDKEFMGCGITEFTRDSFKYSCETLDFSRSNPNLSSMVRFINQLIKNHFDIYGLIPMGLAIDATGLNIY